MGLFFGKNKKNKNNENNLPLKFEHSNLNDDAFLLSAVDEGGVSDDVFESPQEVLDKTKGYGANSGLMYVNKYSSTNQKLATTNVVDVGAYKKPVKEVKEPEPEPKQETASDDDDDDYIEVIDDDDDILLKPVEEEPEVGEKGGSDFDKFFDEFMQKNSEKEGGVGSGRIAKETPTEKPKKVVTRKKKRAIDIDIISGGSGGDII